MARTSVLERIEKIEKEVRQLKEIALEKTPLKLSKEDLDQRDAKILKKAIKRTKSEGWIDFATLVKTYKKEKLI